jgi:aminomethyltransferase
MWMPTVYASPEEDYKALTERVTLWDTAAERQVEIKGPDAARMTDMLTPRNLDTWQPGTCRYVFLCDETGGIINDPVGLKLAEDHYWLSIADSDMMFWVKGLALGMNLDVRIDEPDVSPLQVQGPHATDLMSDLVGDWIEDLKFFHFRETEMDTDFGPAPVVISRTGWSNERGYEIFLRDGKFGNALWRRIMQAGERYGIAPCAPSQPNRLEAGMLSYGADMDRWTNPFELGLDRLVDLGKDREFIGKEALKTIARYGVSRRICGFRVDGDPLGTNETRWDIYSGGTIVGSVTSACWSPKAGSNLALGFLPPILTAPGMKLEIETSGGRRGAVVAEFPFVVTNKKAPARPPMVVGGLSAVDPVPAPQNG